MEEKDMRPDAKKTETSVPPDACEDKNDGRMIIGNTDGATFSATAPTRKTATELPESFGSRAEDFRDTGTRQAPETDYHWNYVTGVVNDRKETDAQRKRSAIAFTVVTVAAFLACFILLGVMMVRYGDSENAGERKVLTTGEVADRILPCTVYIYMESPSGASSGSGFFLSEDGYIATNSHVVHGATKIWVTLYSGEKISATLVGDDPAEDLALLKVAGFGYPAAPFGSFNDVRVGDVAIAIGNPAGAEGAWSTTQGIISALDRRVHIDSSGDAVSMLQTDAPVNHGSSGGPLCNQYGEVIGIVSRKLTDREGMGLAIPIDHALEILRAMK